MHIHAKYVFISRSRLGKKKEKQWIHEIINEGIFFERMRSGQVLRRRCFKSDSCRSFSISADIGTKDSDSDSMSGQTVETIFKNRA